MTDPNRNSDGTLAARSKQPGDSPARRAGAVLTAGVIILLLVVAIVASSAAVAQARGLFGDHRDAHMDRMRDFAGFRIEWMLRKIDASDEQQEEILAIVDTVIDDLAALRGDRDATREALSAALTGDTVDTEALEALRAEKFAALDGASARVVKALGEIAVILTPEQRRELAERAEHRRWRHRRHF